MGDETILSRVRDERRTSHLEFENKIMKKAFWLGAAALLTIFAAGGNWAISQWRINNLTAIQSAHAEENGASIDEINADINHLRENKVSNKELGLTLKPIQQDIETTQEAVKRIESSLFRYTEQQQRVNDKILKALSQQPHNGSHTQ